MYEVFALGDFAMLDLVSKNGFSYNFIMVRLVGRNALQKLIFEIEGLQMTCEPNLNQIE